MLRIIEKHPEEFYCKFSFDGFDGKTHEAVIKEKNYLAYLRAYASNCYTYICMNAEMLKLYCSQHKIYVPKNLDEQLNKIHVFDLSDNWQTACATIQQMEFPHLANVTLEDYVQNKAKNIICTATTLKLVIQQLIEESIKI